jgi:predicted RNA binding protein YcfA (HicA-like mRNA interferase family)
MGALPVISGKQCVKALVKIGFVVNFQKGKKEAILF